MKSQENNSSTYGLRRRVYEFFVGVFFRNWAKKNLAKGMIANCEKQRDIISVEEIKIPGKYDVLSSNYSGYEDLLKEIDSPEDTVAEEYEVLEKDLHKYTELVGGVSPDEEGLNDMQSGKSADLTSEGASEKSFVQKLLLRASKLFKGVTERFSKFKARRAYNQAPEKAIRTYKALIQEHEKLMSEKSVKTSAENFFLAYRACKEQKVEGSDKEPMKESKSENSDVPIEEQSREDRINQAREILGKIRFTGHQSFIDLVAEIREKSDNYSLPNRPAFLYPKEAYDLYKLRSICAKLTKAEEGLLKIKDELQQNGLDANNAANFDHQIRTVQSSINGYTPMLNFGPPMLVVLSGEEVEVLPAEQVVEAEVVGGLSAIETHKVTEDEAIEVPTAEVVEQIYQGAVAIVEACDVYPCDNIPKAHLEVPNTIHKMIDESTKEERKQPIVEMPKKENKKEQTEEPKIGPSADL